MHRWYLLHQQRKLWVQLQLLSEQLGRLELAQGVDFLERRMGETSGRLQAGLHDSSMS